jgi:hypothetical protein
VFTLNYKSGQNIGELIKWVHYELFNLQKLFEVLNRLIKNEAEQLEKELAQVPQAELGLLGFLPNWEYQIKNDNKNHTVLEYALLNECYSDITKAFPSVVWASLFLSSYAFLEHSLVEICDYFCVKNKPLLQASELRDKGINNSRTYLKKIIGLKFPEQIDAWKEILMYNKIRNILMHAGGYINFQKSSNALIIEYIRANQNKLAITQDNYLKMQENFIEDVIKNYTTFFEQLFREIVLFEQKP